MSSERPAQHLSGVARDYPAIWRLIDEFRAGRGRDLQQWPDWCYAPLAGAYAIVSGGGVGNMVPMQMATEIGRVAALAAWRVSQGIYRFDATILDSVWDTPLTGDLPCELFYRLPEWCVYIEIGRDVEHVFLHQPTRLHGVYAHLEYDLEGGPPELRLLLDYEEGLEPYPIHLIEGTIEDSLVTTCREAQQVLQRAGHEAVARWDWIPAAAENFAHVVALVLYLCAENADLTRNGKPTRPSRPKPKKTKRGYRWFPPDQPTVWDAGARVGASLRSAYQQAEQSTAESGDRASPRPHVRRAHWHTYLVGPKRSRRILKWLPPIPVGFRLDEADQLVPVVRAME